MLRKEKIIIFNGPKDEFNKYYSKYYDSEKINYSLTRLVNLTESERNTFWLVQKEQSIDDIPAKEKKVIDLLTVSANEYSGVTEAVINNFVSFISKYNIKKIIIQNPPMEIMDDLNMQFRNSDIHIHNHDYGKITTDVINNFMSTSSKIILGQKDALNRVAQSLVIQQKLNKDNKPIVVMLYGPSGVGKTETGRLLANLLGEKMFYSQFSMFQNEGHLNYLYGDKVQLPSFAKDLLNRTSNIIFLDEFDKANKFVYSALYELFDTGEFEDKNFHVDLKNTVIICTSNYESPEKIFEHLGEPMFFRINILIKYATLEDDVKIKLIDKYYNKLYNQLSSIEKELVGNSGVKEKYINLVKELDNARQIENFIRNEIAKLLIEKVD